MKPSQVGLLSAVFLFLQFSPLPAETVRLRSGNEVEIIDGALTAKGADDVLREASDWLKKGRLDYAREYWKLLTEKGRGTPASRAKAEQERLHNIEYKSFIVLRDGKTFTGRIKADLRMDQLGLDGQQEVPIWAIEEIVAEYHLGFSQVSKTYYPLTLLEIKFRGQKLKASRIAQELEFTIEEEKGPVTRAILGKDYEILRPNNLGEQIETLTNGRILKIVIYPNLITQDW
jgi:hypothetical protein